MGTPGPQKINRDGIAFKLKTMQMSSQLGVDDLNLALVFYRDGRGLLTTGHGR